MRLSHSAALAVLAALAVALFAALQFAAADEHEHLTVTFGDSDNIIGDNQEVTVTVTMHNQPTGANYTLTWVASPGAFPVTEAADDNASLSTLNTDSTKAANAETKFFIPKGTEGKFSVTARVTRGQLNGEDADPVFTNSGTFTVGDPGKNVASVEISLGKIGHAPATARATRTDGAATGAYGDSAPARWESCHDNPAVANDSETNEGTLDDAISESCIAVTVSALNTAGNPSNSSTIESVHVFAPLGTIIYDSTVEAFAAVDLTTAVAADTQDDSVELEDDRATASTHFFIASENPGTVNVTAIVVDAKGSATSTGLELTFTGPATSITLSEPSSPLSASGTAYVAAKDAVEDDENTNEDETAAAIEEAPGVGVANIEVNAADDAGNPAVVPELTVVIEDADGVDASGTITDNQRTKPGTLTRIVEIIGTNAKPGTYKVTVSLNADEEQTTEVVVAGKVADVAVEVSSSSVELGDIITVTATVTDADGNLQPDAGVVKFTAVGSLKLTGLGNNGEAGKAEGALDDGVAEGRFVVVDGSGTATIIASLSGVDGVTAVSTEAAEAMPEEEASVSCLSNLAGFATWACGVESSASEIFDLVSGRGATALHLWNGSAWVRYSVVNGTMVPGSSDFMVAENDILYISN